MNSKLKSQEGLTIVDVLLASAILGILAMYALSGIIETKKLSQRVSQTNEALSITENYAELLYQLSEAGKLPNQDNLYQYQFSQDNWMGKIEFKESITSGNYISRKYKGIPATNKNYYSDITLALDVTKPGIIKAEIKTYNYLDIEKKSLLAELDLYVKEGI